MLSVSTLGPSFLVRSRLQSALTRLSSDDSLLLPALPGLDLYELRQAVSERGGLSDSVEEVKLKAWLGRWFESVRKSTLR